MDDIRHTFTTQATEREVGLAVTTRDGLAGWWGHRVEVGQGMVTLTFTKEGREIVMEFEVESQENPIVWSCTKNGNPAWIGTTLTWTTTESDGERIVDFSHTGFEIGGPPYESTVEIWRHFMSSLEAYLRTGEGQPWP